MKFLHLSDLHIGKIVNGFSMLADQKHVFAQVTGYISSLKPDALIIAGDVYDRAIPGVEAVRVFDDFLTELAAMDVALLLISGNHDSPERLNYASRLLKDKRLYLYGAFDGAIHKVSLADEYGLVNFWLLPFIKPIAVRGMLAEQESESYDEMIKLVLAAANIDYSERNVLISHQFYSKAGLNLERSDSELNPIGGLDAVDAGLIGSFDYAALGHLHGRQSVGEEHIRYCGSPLKYSFSEWRQQKSITFVELGIKGQLTLSLLPLAPLHDMREIKGGIDILMNEEISGATDNEDYLRIILTDEEEIVDPLGKLRSVYPNIMSLGFENSRAGIDADTIKTDCETVEKLSPFELFAEFFLDMQGTPMNAEQMGIVRKAFERKVDEE
ncbi:MAG: exonuclease SbcCD subunit D [Clostridiales bacterium]|nr:exonuclease SbcCD subunit D [Clostridiales bacterium]